MKPPRKFVRAPGGDGITWVGPHAAQGAHPGRPPVTKRKLAKPLVGFFAVLALQGVILLAFRAKEDERASHQTVAGTMAQPGGPSPSEEAVPAWSTPLARPVFPGLEAIRRSGEAHVVRKPGARLAGCPGGSCE